MFSVNNPEIAHISPADLGKLQASELHGSCLIFRSGILLVHPELASLITQDERERSERFMLDRDRQTYVAAHAVLRLVLKNIGGEVLSTAAFAQGKYGKPHLPSAIGLKFNLSHSRDRIALAFYRDQELGVDVEWQNPDIDVQEVGSRVYSPSELDYISSGGSEAVARFYELWTRKEALIKKAGFGLSTPIDLRQINVLEQVPTLEGLPETAPEWMKETVIETYSAPDFGIFSRASVGVGEEWKCYNLSC